MVFSSNVFLFAYLPVMLLLYFLLPRKLKNPVLLLWSLVFYGWGEPVYLFLMIATIAMNYLFGLWISRCSSSRGAKGVLAAGVAANLLMLGFFKYAGFLFAQLQLLIPALRSVSAPEIALPIGISFYVFQSMSYIIDVYRKDAPVQKNPLTFGTYVALFPQLIAGPIVRYQDVAQQLESRRENVADFSSGVLLFITGLSKKVLIANAMGMLWEGVKDAQGIVTFAGLSSYEGTLAAWAGLIAYALQIYFDFSGYSDMARGLGRMLGFEFLENFNYPYISRSITEFWRRWHISLSTWFKEYVYIPLGGNRKGLPRQLLNIFIVWALTGLWHGASWNFVLWGLYYALLLVAEKVFLLKLLKKMPAFLSHVYAMLAVLLGWALFYFQDLGALGSFFGRLFTLRATPEEGVVKLLGFLPVLLFAAVAATPLGKRINAAWGDTPLLRWGKVVLAAVLLVLCVAALASSSFNPFIYFQF